MLIYLWVKSEPYGLVSLKTHKEFEIKGTGTWQICFVFHWTCCVKKNRTRMLLVLNYCSHNCWVLTACRKWCLEIHTRYLNLHHNPGSLGGGEGGGEWSAFPTRSTVLSPGSLLPVGILDKMGKIWNPGFVQQWQLFLLKSPDSGTKKMRIYKSVGFLRSHSQHTFSLFNELRPA